MSGGLGRSEALRGFLGLPPVPIGLHPSTSLPSTAPRGLERMNGKVSSGEAKQPQRWRFDRPRASVGGRACWAEPPAAGPRHRPCCPDNRGRCPEGPPWRSVRSRPGSQPAGRPGPPQGRRQVCPAQGQKQTRGHGWLRVVHHRPWKARSKHPPSSETEAESWPWSGKGGAGVRGEAPVHCGGRHAASSRRVFKRGARCASCNTVRPAPEVFSGCAALRQ